MIVAQLRDLLSDPKIDANAEVQIKTSDSGLRGVSTITFQTEYYCLGKITNPHKERLVLSTI